MDGAFSVRSMKCACAFSGRKWICKELKRFGRLNLQKWKSRFFRVVWWLAWSCIINYAYFVCSRFSHSGLVVVWIWSCTDIWQKSMRTWRFCKKFWTSVFVLSSYDQRYIEYSSWWCIPRWDWEQRRKLEHFIVKDMTMLRVVLKRKLHWNKETQQSKSELMSQFSTCTPCFQFNETIQHDVTIQSVPVQRLLKTEIMTFCIH